MIKRKGINQENICSPRISYLLFPSYILYITIIDQFSFFITHVSIIGLLECGKTRCGWFIDVNFNGDMKLKNNYAEKYNETSGIYILS